MLLLLALSETTLTPPPPPGVEFWVSVVLGFFGLVGGGAGLAAILRVRAQNRLALAETDDTFESARSSIMEMINEGTQTLKNDLAEARNRIRDLQNEVESLRHKLDKDQAAKRIGILERDVLFWRSRSEALQVMLDSAVQSGYVEDRRNYDEGPPDELGIDRRD